MAHEDSIPRTSETVASDLRNTGNWLATLCRIHATHPEIRDVADRYRALDTELSLRRAEESDAFLESLRETVESTRDLVRRLDAVQPPAEGDWQLGADQ